MKEKYFMSVKTIKDILLEENRSYFKGLKEKTLIEYYQYIFRLVENYIVSLDSYDAIEQFVIESRHMSLSEWIDSL